MVYPLLKNSSDDPYLKFLECSQIFVADPPLKYYYKKIYPTQHFLDKLEHAIILENEGVGWKQPPPPPPQVLWFQNNEMVYIITECYLFLEGKGPFKFSKARLKLDQ